jgi:hypothetical protein
MGDVFMSFLVRTMMFKTLAIDPKMQMMTLMYPWTSR